MTAAIGHPTLRLMRVLRARVHLELAQLLHAKLVARQHPLDGPPDDLLRAPLEEVAERLLAELALDDELAQVLVAQALAGGPARVGRRTGFMAGALINIAGCTLAVLAIRNLAFPHATHLDPRGVKSPEKGRVKLECKSCHQPDASKRTFEPISMPTWPAALMFASSFDARSGSCSGTPARPARRAATSTWSASVKREDGRSG